MLGKYARPDPSKCASRIEFYTGNLGDCPVCNPSKLVYGPLTEELLAEFLCNCPDVSDWADWKDADTSVEFGKNDFRAMARGVIRLLHEVTTYQSQDDTSALFSDTIKCRTPRDWLLNLAKED